MTTTKRMTVKIVSPVVVEVIDDGTQPPGGGVMKSSLSSIDDNEITNPLMTFIWQGLAPATVTIDDDRGGGPYGPFTVVGNDAQATGLTLDRTYTVTSQAQNSEGVLDDIVGSFFLLPALVQSSMDSVNSQDVPNPVITYTWAGNPPTEVYLDDGG